LLVPFAAAADDHQRKNAEVLVEVGAAAMLLERELTEATLLDGLRGLLLDAGRRGEMAVKARSLARARALERIAGMVVGLAGG
jgi:UDP-N-acetylglucosamine--N-acetylmuramyl-(pentapeptide) pyrophosphoryl-undecaprenol N-acetylglucosamine transferase